MSAGLACRGRIGRDPDKRETKTGDPMVLSSMAIDITGYGCEEPITMWLGLVAFGQVAERLSRVRRGDTLSVHGQFTQKPYVGKDGSEQPGFSLLVESMISHRPKVGKKRKKAYTGTSDDAAAVRLDEPDDPLPF